MNLALFDFDGTITTGDTFIPFLRYSVRSQKLVLGAVVLSPLLAAYKLRLVSSSAARPAAARFAFRGEDAAVIRRLGNKYAHEVLPTIVRPHALERLHWHKRQGDVVVVVSAALDVYLTHWCHSVGADVICTHLEEQRGMFTGRYVDGDCCGLEKARRIRNRYDLSRY